jgi:plastocyanin
MTSPFRGRALAAGALVVPALALAACGSSNKSSSNASTSGGKAQPASTNAATTAAPAAGGAGSVQVAADPSGALKFDKTTLNAKAGRVTIAMTNPSSTPHSIAVEGHGVDKDSAQKSALGGSTATVTSVLKPGRYVFYCPVDGHKQAGMKGVLVVS